MTRYGERHPFRFRTCGITARAVAAALVACVGACDAPAALEQAAEARRLATTLQAEFAQAVEAAHRTVMTETDPASSESAREAEAARARVKSAERKLEGLLTKLQYADERKLLEDFHGKFAAYEVLDTKILELAVEKSNVRATQLAFGPAREAAEIVALSRRNTNVRSLELTLGQKRKVIATCDASLRALHDALVERARRPTR